MTDRKTGQEDPRKRWKRYGIYAITIAITAATAWFILFKMSDADASTLATLTVGFAAAAIAGSQYRLAKEIEIRTINEERMRRAYESPRIEVVNFHTLPFAIEVKIRNSGLSPALTLSIAWNSGEDGAPLAEPLGTLAPGESITSSHNFATDGVLKHWPTLQRNTEPISVSLKWDSIDGPKHMSTEIPDRVLTQTWWRSVNWAHSYIYGYSYYEDAYGRPYDEDPSGTHPTPADIREANELSEKLRENRIL